MCKAHLVGFFQKSIQTMYINIKLFCTSVEKVQTLNIYIFSVNCRDIFNIKTKTRLHFQSVNRLCKYVVQLDSAGSIFSFFMIYFQRIFISPIKTICYNIKRGLFCAYLTGPQEDLKHTGTFYSMIVQGAEFLVLFLLLSFSCSQVVIKKSSNNNFFSFEIKVIY